MNRHITDYLYRQAKINPLLHVTSQLDLFTLNELIVMGANNNVIKTMQITDKEDIKEKLKRLGTSNLKIVIINELKDKISKLILQRLSDDYN